MEEGGSEGAGSSGTVTQRPPPPPSPLTGCYLLIVVGEPHSDRHKELILQQLAQGLLTWDCNDCHVDLERELQAIVASKPEGDEARYGERLVQFATENLVTEILVHPQLNTLQQCMKNLLSSFTKHRHIIHAGYTFKGNGSWILQDGTISLSDMVDALHEPEVLRVLRAYEGTVSVFIHCATEGKWSTQRLQSEPVSKLCRVIVNPPQVLPSDNVSVASFLDYVSGFLMPASLSALLQPTDVVGNIRFTHPTLYVFPGGQGDAALFGINGFNMLVDGGFARKACFWDFARHLDRLDAVLLTRLNNSTVQGIAAVLRRKKMSHAYPQIGHFFCNLQDRKISLSPEGSQDEDSLIVSLAEEGREIVSNLRHLALKPHPCYRDGHQVDPVNLYHKVGHGKLDMYVISPARDSKVVKEFLAKWQAEDSDLFTSASRKIGGRGFDFPLQNLVSICALLVWQPANPDDTITRILFPGSTPQDKVFEGLEKLRHLEFLKHPICSARTVTPSTSTVPLVKKIVSKTKTATVQKQKPLKAKPIQKEPKPKIDTNKLIEDTLEAKQEQIIQKDEKIEKIEKEIKKIEKENGVENIIADIEKIEKIDAEVKKATHRSKYDMKNVKSKVDSRAPSKSIDRKKGADKKTDSSPPATPKKIVANGTAAKSEKPKSAPKAKISPTATPAKSAKEANNRKVVEARVTSRITSTSATTKVASPRQAKKEETEKKKQPITRRPKAASPAPKPTTKPDSVPRKVIKKLPIDLLEKASTDSTVSTPSADVDIVTKQRAVERKEKRTQESKTEVGEKEAEIDSALKDVESVETDTKAVKEQVNVIGEVEKEQLQVKLSHDSTKSAEEGEDEEEYLIVTKEESVEGEEIAKDEGESLQEEVETKDETEGEGEMKKLQMDEQDSEKKRKILEEGLVEDLPEDEETKQDEEEDKPEDEVDKQIERAGLDSDESVNKKEIKSEAQKLGEMDEGVDIKETGSKELTHPDEKFSTTVETSATTAPTLPEDERVPLEGLKEEERADEEVKEVVEEKYIKEETKEKIVDNKQERPEQPTSLPQPCVTEIPLPFAAKAKSHARDLVKTPDEVADLPVHEEVDPSMYTSGEFNRDLQAKVEDSGKPAIPTVGEKQDAEKLSEEHKEEGVAEKTDEPEKIEELDTQKEETVGLDTEKKDEEPEKDSAEKDTEEAKIVSEQVKEEQEIIAEDTATITPEIGKITSEEPSQPKSGAVSPGETSPEHVVKELEEVKHEEEIEEKESKVSVTTSPEKIITNGEIVAEISKQPEEEQGTELKELKSPLKSGATSAGSASPEHAQKEITEIEKTTIEPVQLGLPEKDDPEETVKSSEVPTGKTIPDAVLKTIELAAGKISPQLNELKSGEQSTGKASPEPVLKSGGTSTGKVSPELVLQSGEVSAGKASPEPVLKSGEASTGKASPEPVLKSGATSTGKASPEPELKSGATWTGKASPEPVLKSGEASTGKGSPEPVLKSGATSTGKASPEHELKSGATSKGKASPEPVLKSGEASTGKGSPEPVLKSGATSTGKASPEPVLKSGEVSAGKISPEPVLKSGATSTGKASPEPVLKSGEVSAGKISPEPVLKSGEISTGKASPELVLKSGEQSVGKTSPEPVFKDSSTGKASPELVLRSGEASAGKTSPEPVLKSGEISKGKTSPEPVLKESSTGKASPELVLKSGEASAGKTSPEPVLKSGEISQEKTSPEPALKKSSGKTSPEPVLKESSTGKTSPEPVLKSGEAKTGKTSPELALKSGEVSVGKASPELILESVESGKVSPTAVHSELAEPEEATNDSTLKSGEISTGKASPEPGKTSAGKLSPALEDDKGKTSPDTLLKSGEISKGTTSPGPTVHAAVASPEKDQGGVAPETLLLKIDELSGKISPEPLLKSGEVSTGKASPEPPAKSGEISAEKTSPVKSGQVSTGKMSPEPVLLKSGEASTGKISPEPALLKNGEASTGKMSPEPTLLKSGEVSTGKVSPEPTLLKSGEVSTGKVSPEPTLLKSGEVSAGKVSPEPGLKSGAESPSKGSPEPPKEESTKPATKPEESPISPEPILKTSETSTKVATPEPVLTNGEASSETIASEPKETLKISPETTDQSKETISDSTLKGIQLTAEQTSPSSGLKCGEASPGKISSTVSSGKASPEPVIKTQELLSGKTSPEEKLSCADVNKQASEITQEELKVGQNLHDDAQKSSEKSEQGSPEKTTGKSSPVEKNLSGKTTPDSVLKGNETLSKSPELDLKNAEISPGKTSPELPKSPEPAKEIPMPLSAAEQTIDEQEPGSEELKKQIPETTQTSTKTEIGEQMVSPVPKSGKISNGKASPETLVEVIDASSGAVSPEPKMTGPEQKDFEPKSEEKGTSSGKSTPDSALKTVEEAIMIVAKQAVSMLGSEISNQETISTISVEKAVTSAVSSGKISPEPSLKSGEVSNGKITPEPALGSGEQIPGKVANESTRSGEASAGKQSPELLLQSNGKIISEPQIKSGETSPAKSIPEQSAVEVLETEIVLSVKNGEAPKTSPHGDEILTEAITSTNIQESSLDKNIQEAVSKTNGDLTEKPAIDPVVGKSSGKSTPEAVGNGIEDIISKSDTNVISEMSGKTTPADISPAKSKAGSESGKSTPIESEKLNLETKHSKESSRRESLSAVEPIHSGAASEIGKLSNASSRRDSKEEIKESTTERKDSALSDPLKTSIIEQQEADLRTESPIVLSHSRKDSIQSGATSGKASPLPASSSGKDSPQISHSTGMDSLSNASSRKESLHDIASPGSISPELTTRTDSPQLTKVSSDIPSPNVTVHLGSDQLSETQHDSPKQSAASSRKASLEPKSPKINSPVAKLPTLNGLKNGEPEIPFSGSSTAGSSPTALRSPIRTPLPSPAKPTEAFEFEIEINKNIQAKLSGSPSEESAKAGGKIDTSSSSTVVEMAKTTVSEKSLQEVVHTSGKSTPDVSEVLEKSITPLEKQPLSAKTSSGLDEAEKLSGICTPEKISEVESSIKSASTSSEPAKVALSAKSSFGMDDKNLSGKSTPDLSEPKQKAAVSSDVDDNKLADGRSLTNGVEKGSNEVGEKESLKDLKVVDKVEKDDINEQVKKEDNTAAVKRMLVTASSEDGGAETEICAQGSIVLGGVESSSSTQDKDGSEDEDSGDFSSLIKQAKKEYNKQRSRIPSNNSSEGSDSEEPRKKQQEISLKRTRKTTTKEEKKTGEDGSTITITTITIVERDEQLDGSFKVTTTIETITNNGKSEEKTVKVTTSVEKPEFSEEQEVMSPLSVTSQAAGFDFEEYTREKVEEFAKKEESKSSEVQKKPDIGKEDSRRTSASSIISQEDLVSRMESRLDEFKGSSSSVELSPLKTTYITSQAPASESEALMTSSFYGCSPAEEQAEAYYPKEDILSTICMKGIPEPISEVSESQPESPEERIDFAKALDEHRSARGEDLGPSTQPAPKPDAAVSKDPIAGWGKPLGLPSPPKNAYKSYFPMGQNISTTSSLSTPTDNSDSVTNWGQPMSLPQPAPPTATAAAPAEPEPQAEPKETPTKKPAPKKSEPKVSGTHTPNRRAESPARPIDRSKQAQPLYVDLTYVPHHGNSYYSNVEFFKRVRARYYVFSGTEPSKEVYNALLEAKQCWEEKDLEVTIIPTYDTDVLGYWVAENEETLAKHKIDLSPSASRCTINLQDHETSCSAYRLEF